MCVYCKYTAEPQIWLRDCVYKRLVTKGKKPGTLQSMATFLTSAIWVSSSTVLGVVIYTETTSMESTRDTIVSAKLPT